VNYSWIESGTNWSESGSGFEGVSHFGFGGWFFIDATFAEFSVALMGGPALWGGEEDWTWTSSDQSESGTWRGWGGLSFFALDLSLLGRLPIEVGNGNVSIFPLLGIGYNIVLTTRRPNGDDAFEDSDDHSAINLSTFRIQLGVGGDFDVVNNIFFRLSILGNYRFAPTVIRDWADDWASTTGHRGGFGGTVKMGVGVRL